MNTKTGIVLMCMVSALLAAVIVLGNSMYGIFGVGALAEVILFLSAIIFPLYGFYTAVFVSAFIFFPERITGAHLPISVAIEFLILAVYIGILLKNRVKKPDNSGFYRAPYTIALSLFFIFLLVEVFNPNMYSVAYSGVASRAAGPARVRRSARSPRRPQAQRRSGSRSAR